MTSMGNCSRFTQVRSYQRRSENDDVRGSHVETLRSGRFRPVLIGKHGTCEPKTIARGHSLRACNNANDVLATPVQTVKNTDATQRPRGLMKRTRNGSMSVVHEVGNVSNLAGVKLSLCTRTSEP